MESVTRRASEWKYNLTVALMVFITASVLVLVISQASVDSKNVFYAVLLSNILLVGYLMLLRDISLGVILYLYSLTFLNHYWRLVIPGRWPDIDLPRMMFVFIWFVILIETVVGGRRLQPRTRIETAMLFLLTVILVVMVTKGHLQIRQFLNGYAIPFAMFVCAKNIFKTKDQLQRFLLWLAVPLCIYFPVNHMFEYFRLTQFVFPRYILSPEISGQEVVWGGRAMGAFLQPVATGSAMVTMYLLGMYKLSKMGGVVPRLIKVFITLLTPVAVFFTHTRSVYLGYFAAMVILLLFSRKQRLAALFVIVAVILGILGNWSNVTTGNRQAGGLATRDTVQGRLVLAEVSLRMFQDRPFVGVGFTRFQEYSHIYVRTVRSTVLGYREAWIGKHVNQHNQLLTVLTEIGLIGFIPLVLIYCWLFMVFIRARRTQVESYDSDFVVTVWAIWVGYMINIQFMEPRFFEFMNAFPYILAGIVVGGYQRAMLKSGITGFERKESVK